MTSSFHNQFLISPRVKGEISKELRRTVPPEKKQDNTGISFDDLLGKTVKVRYIGIKAMTEKKGVLNMVLEVEQNGEVTSFGIIGEKVRDSVLAKGEKDNGSIFLNVPEKILKMTPEGKVQWLNTPI